VIAAVFPVGRPELLWLLWLVPLIALFQVWVFRRKDTLLHRFVDPDLAERLLAGVSRPRQIFKAGLVTAAIGLGLLSLAELRYGFTWEEVRREGVDLVIALDVSDSMLVKDADTGGDLTRLERARREVADLLDLMDGDRVGLVAFSGTAFIECPLTLDYGAAELFLRDVDTDLIPVKGTALGKAIRTSLRAFDGSAQDSRAILLITDGEDHTGEALAAAEEAKEAGVRVFVIGIGRDEGSPIPDPGGGYRKDRRGELILSKLDEPTLQKIALTTGGKYVRSVTGDLDLETVYLQGVKASVTSTELESTRRKRWYDRYQWLIGAALLLLLLEPLIPERSRRSDAA
jgi:Ca-activated chloride channel family protein